MPPRPFPFPFRVGNDICNIARIHAIIVGANAKRSHSVTSSLKRFLPRFLTWPEQQYFYRRFERDIKQSEIGSIASSERISQFLAGRWAAKEAVRKACEHLGSSNGFHHIIILPVTSSSSQPGATSRPQALLLHDRFIESGQSSPASASTPDAAFDIESLDGQLCEVGISHDTHYASAVALVPIMEERQLQGVASNSLEHGP